MSQLNLFGLNDEFDVDKDYFGTGDYYYGGLSNAVDDVLKFMEQMGQASATKPAIPDGKTIRLRLSLIEEEAKELDFAMNCNNLANIADGIADLIYVLIGTAISYGIPLPDIWVAVQRANMAKASGPVRDDGKRLKPEGWQPPDIEGILRRHGWDGR